MSQQINLLNPALIKKKDLFNTNNIAILCGFIFVGLITIGFYEQSALTDAKTAKKASAKKLTQVQTLLTQMRAKAANNPEQKRLLAEIEQLENKEAMQEAVLEAAQHDQSHQGQSYAALLKAFARQSMDGIWITSLSIDQDAQHLSISGRTTNPDLVPAYIAKLRNEPVLKDKSFTNLTMQYNTQILNNSETTANTEDKTQTVATSTNNTKVTIDKVATANNTQQPIEYIEFSLRSIPDDKEKIIDKAMPQLAGAH